MNSVLPVYPPDFARHGLATAPLARVMPAPADGVAPAGFHATSNHPEYVHRAPGRWLLVRESRMDAVLVVSGNAVEAREPRRLRKGDPVEVGRSHDGSEGIYLHTTGFVTPDRSFDPFAFRTHETRESPSSRSYDRLSELLRHDRKRGTIVWVLGPAATFDRDSRDAMAFLIGKGFCHALMAGNALATHDLEAARFGTALGVNISTGVHAPGGHRNHLELINEVRDCGSIQAAIGELRLQSGIMVACARRQVPWVLAGSIRDDGPLPGVITDTCQAQDAMRVHARRATTVIALATQLHTIAFGNMVPTYRVMPDDTVRPVYFYSVDLSEFSLDKLADRGSSQTIPILTNVQDFLVNLRHNLS